MKTTLRTLLALVAVLVLVGLGASLSRVVGGALSLPLAIPVVVWLGLEAGVVEGAVAAAVVGVLLDGAAGGPTGLHVFLSVMLFLASRVASRSVDARAGPGFGLLSGAGMVVFGLGALLLQRYVSPADAAPRWGLAGRVLVQAVLCGLAAPAVRLALDRFGASLDREEPRLLP
ncbi:MAG TPA: hypothetical protein VMT17_09380 [Anaeromyxobacteraceae bacterium]|nr:hypothetical protein [Anaeromyxobacteraceae bacterium]